MMVENHLSGCEQACESGNATPLRITPAMHTALNARDHQARALTLRSILSLKQIHSRLRESQAAERPIRCDVKLATFCTEAGC
jgi:hypothetical protein